MLNDCIKISVFVYKLLCDIITNEFYILKKKTNEFYFVYICCFCFVGSIGLNFKL